ncbi:MAG: hypothetical protein ABIV36_26045 [Sphingobium limneticum]
MDIVGGILHEIEQAVELRAPGILTAFAGVDEDANDDLALGLGIRPDLGLLAVQ